MHKYTLNIENDTISIYP